MQNSRSEKQQTFMKAKSKNEEILRESVSQVLQVNPDGIPVLQFPEVYKVYTMVNTILPHFYNMMMCVREGLAIVTATVSIGCRGLGLYYRYTCGWLITV